MADTICHRFLQTCDRHGSRVALKYKRGARWTDITWSLYRESVDNTAAGLASLGLQAKDRIAVFASTRYEWAICDMAILSMGATTVGIYHNILEEDVNYILKASKCRAIICENPKLAQQIDRSLVESVTLIENSSEKAADSDWLTLAELQAKGELHLKQNPDFLTQSVSQIKMDDWATLHFTSGTSGKPKGVVLTHTQIMSEVGDAFPLLGVNSQDRSLSFMPYAHVLGRIEIWGHALVGYTMAFAESIDRIKNNIQEIEPTIMIAVPRIFEKIYNGILSQVGSSKWKSNVFFWALGVGKQVAHYRMHKQTLPLDLSIQHKAASRLVFDAIYKKLGGQLRFCVSGGAPLSPEIAEFFGAIGILILEGYGLTETTAAICVNTPFDYRFGTVGKPVGDVKIKIAEDGEILVQSKKVMQGYLDDEAATQAVMSDGWFHTGDIGEVTPEGFVRITDRKKDLIKTAGGKYVAPQKLEGMLKLNPYVSNVHIHGDQKKYIVALLTLAVDGIEKWAKEQGITWSDLASLSQNQKVQDLLRKCVADVNSQLASFETIKNFAVLPVDFSIETGELTPSLKVKRKVVDKKYHDLIERLYS